jgi:hypothetical protein
MKHGAWAYSHGQCRCDECRAGWRAWQLRSNDNRAARLAVDPTLAPHGKRSTYTNWRCRCDPCRAAQSAWFAAYSARRKAAVS